MDNIEVLGARVHNLKNINVTIPRNSLTVITGLSGSGKSSLAFDTLYAEGQRRYIETFSAYARNFLGGMERPDVDKISGLSPVISIEQKTTNKNPRSTVGTVTEVCDFMRLLFARAGTAYSYVTGEKMVKYTEDKILELILNDYEGKAIYILAPLVRSRKGHYRELFDSMRRKGYLNIRVDGVMMDIVADMKVDRYKNHNIEVVVDKLVVNSKDTERLRKSIEIAMKLGEGLLMLLQRGAEDPKFYSKRLMCPTTGISYNDPAPNNFSFNSPEGYCPRCKGLGYVSLIDEDKIVPNRNLSVSEGGLAPLGKSKNSMIFFEIEAVLEMHGFNLKTPIKDISAEALHDVIYGCDERICIKASKLHTSSDYFCEYGGIAKFIHQLSEDDNSAQAQRWAESFDRVSVCPDCQGARLRKESLCYKIGEYNIHQLSKMDLGELYDWSSHIHCW